MDQTIHNISTKILSSTTFFNNYNNKKCYLSRLECLCFLKDNVTLKTGVTDAESLALHHRNNLHYNLKYIKTENHNLIVFIIFHSTTVFTVK